MLGKVCDREAARLDALHEFDVLDTLPEKDYDDLTRLASVICDTPIVLVSLIDKNRQWFKSRYGIDAVETPREQAFCAHAIHQYGVFIVPDASLDVRFRNNPLVTGGPSIRFYAGAPLTTPEGFNLGTLCVIDRKPRELTEQQQDALVVLSRQVVAQLMLRRQVKQLKLLVEEKQRIETMLRVAENRFRSFMDNSPTVAFMKNDSGQYIYMNRILCERFHLSRADWDGKTDFDLWPLRAQAVLDLDAGIWTANEPVVAIEMFPTPDRAVCYWQTYKFPFSDSYGNQFIAGISVDITAQKVAEIALRESEERFRRVVEEIDEGVVLIDRQTRFVLQSNRAFGELLAYTPEELLRLTQYDFVAHERTDTDLMMARTAEQGRLSIGYRRYRRKDRSIITVWVSGSVLLLEGKEVFCLTVRDVTQQLRFEERLQLQQAELEETNLQLQTLSLTDALTGVRNRRAFDRGLVEARSASERHRRPFSLLLLDVDHFKDFNDTFGHPAGDAVLKRVAEILASVARCSDTLARYGGEEFAIILPETDIEGAIRMAERCREAVCLATWADRAVTVSIGISTTRFGANIDPRDPFCLLEQADTAMYHSKQSGRNRVTHAAWLDASNRPQAAAPAQ